MAVPDRPDPDSLDDALRADHERLDALLSRLETSFQSGSAAAAEVLGPLSRGLTHHMAWEDAQLFPAVKQVASAKERRSIESLEIDHERLRETLRSLESSLAAGDLGAAEPLARWLTTLLRGHNYDEEHGVYVDADRLLSPDERKRMIEQFEADRPKF
jgi:hemerythrin-like domain-containing protein